MEVRLLGTGSAEGWPNPFCRCASCEAERAAGRLRGQTSALVDGRLLLDCGPEAARAAERCGADLAGVRHVLITHAHPDHCAPTFLLFHDWASGGPLDVVGPPEVVETCRPWVGAESPVRFVEVSPGDRLTLSSYDVRVLEARHGEPGAAVLYDVTTPNGRLLYATDTGPLPEHTVEAMRGAAFDLVLLEETFGTVVDHDVDHLDLRSFPEQLRRLREAGAVSEDTDVVAVHLSHRNPPLPELTRRLADWRTRVVPDGTLVSGAADPTTTSLGDGDEGPVAARGPVRTLVLGGARSGKSREAERILAAEPDVCYVATSYPADSGAPDDSEPANRASTASAASHDGPALSDLEWAERVRRHCERRPPHWATVETVDLVALLETPGPALLLDCLTLWLTRVMDRHDAWDETAWRDGAEAAVSAEIEALVAAWRGTRRPRVVAVSNEVGQGVVPPTAAGRRFQDLMGHLNAAVAAATEDVRWCVAGRVSAL